MRCKKAIGFMSVMFIILVLVLPTVCVFIPYRDPYFEDYTDVYYEEVDGEVNYYLAGAITNPSICTINGFKIKISYYDENFNCVSSQVIEKEIELGSGKTYEFSELLVANNKWDLWAIEYAEYSFTTLQPYYFYAIGLCLFGITLLFFIKKKFYFNVDSHKVSVYATTRKAVLVINGKIYKELVVASRGETASCQFKIKGQILAITLKMGNYFPDVEITVDGVIPKFTKIKQNSFLKPLDKKQIEKQAQKNTSN